MEPTPPLSPMPSAFPPPHTVSGAGKVAAIVLALVLVAALAFYVGTRTGNRNSEDVATESASPSASASASPSNSPQVTADLTTYSNDEYGFALDHPLGWSVCTTPQSQKDGTISERYSLYLVPSATCPTFAVSGTDNRIDWSQEQQSFEVYVKHITIGGLTPTTAALKTELQKEAKEVDTSANAASYSVLKELTVADGTVFCTSKYQQSPYGTSNPEVTLYRIVGDYVVAFGNNSLTKDKNACDKMGDMATLADSLRITAPLQTYTNAEFGFQLKLPPGWSGYIVAKGTWSGNTFDQNGNTNQNYTGPQFVLSHPNTNGTWQTIPIMVYTLAQWAVNPNVSAAPVDPALLGKNNTYAFATPPRWVGFFDSIGQTQAQQIVSTFKALPPR